MTTTAPQPTAPTAPQDAATAAQSAATAARARAAAGGLPAFDRLLELAEGESAVAVRNVPATLECFTAHFPRHPVLPGVLLLESLAALARTAASPGAWRLARRARGALQALRRPRRPGPPHRRGEPAQPAAHRMPGHRPGRGPGGRHRPRPDPAQRHDDPGGHSMSEQRRRVMVTGIGLMTAIGQSAAETWDSLLEGRCGIGPLRAYDPAPLRTGIGAEIHGFDPTRWAS
ncbi:beta-ketoacyl synthase N-terminal-like domain-containing protein [Streptomyces kaempferi]